MKMILKSDNIENELNIFKQKIEQKDYFIKFQIMKRRSIILLLK